MPDKAIDVLDEAASRVRLQFTSEPEELTQLRAESQKLEAEREALTRAGQHKEAAEIKMKLEQLREKMAPLENEVARARGTGTPEVTIAHINEVVSRMSGVPITELNQEEKQKLRQLEQRLHQRVVGQDEAVRLVSEAVRRSRAGLKDPHRPIASFLFLGPTGVGKTELAKALAETVFGDEDAIIRLDMSEFMEKFAVSRLIGSPPGYIGYDEGGQLTEKVRRKPYSIILLDEFEKAHPDVSNILLQVMEDGRLTDSKGRVVDFKNTILIATSNLGANEILAHIKETHDQQVQPATTIPETKLIRLKTPETPQTTKNWDNLKDTLMQLLKKQLRPELLNRFDEIIVFSALNQKQIEQIVAILLDRTAHLLSAQDINLAVDQAVVRRLAELGYDPEFGARSVRRTIQREIENPLTDRILSGDFQRGDSILVKLNRNGFEFLKEPS